MTEKPTYEELEKRISKLEQAELDRKNPKESLQQIGEKFRLIFEHAPLGILHFDRYGTITTCNDNFVKIIGSSKEALVGLNMLKLPDQRIVDALKTTLKGRATSFEGYYSSLTAEKITPIRLLFNALLSKNGTVEGGIGIIEDTTKRVRAEEALKESEEKHRKFIDNAPIGMYTTNMKGEFTYSNKKLEELTGYKKENWLNKSFQPIVHPDDLKIIENKIRLRVEGQGSTESFEIRIFDSKGEIRWVKINSESILEGEKGLKKLIGMQSFVEDITKRKRSEAALHDSEKKYRHLFNNAPAGMYEIDFVKIKFINVNEAMCEYSGYSEDDFLSMNPLDLLTEDSKKLFLARLGTDENISDNVEYNILKKNGQELCVILSSDFIYDNGILKGARVVAHDITERKKIEDMMIQTEKMMSVGGLAAGMAHEINNPLAGMMQNAQVIHNRLSRDFPANEKVATELGSSMAVIKRFMEKRGILKQLDSIHQAGGHAAKIIENMLSFARKSNSIKTEHHLNELIDKTLNLSQNDYNLKKKYDFKQIEISKEYSPDIPAVLCEGSKIQQVIFNLIKNASEAMASENLGNKKSKLILRVYKKQKMACIEIEDNGPGMDHSARKRIFEPFFTTKNVDQGTGLGLSVSYFIIVDDHGGKIEVESVVGKGTKFIIKLPIK